MAQARCSLCGATIKKTSGYTLCERCQALDRVLLTETLAYLKEGPDFSRYQYELCNDIEGVDEQRLRRWLRLGVIEKTGQGKLGLVSKIKRGDNSALVQIYESLLKPSSRSIGNLQNAKPKMVTEELVIQDDS